MHKRFYLCPVIGSGTEADPYRPKVAMFTVNGFQITDQTSRTHVVVEVDADNYSALDADADLTELK